MEWLGRMALSSPTRVFGSQNLTTVKLKGVGESFKKYPDHESKGIKAHFNLDESGVLSLIRVRPQGGPGYKARAQAPPVFPEWFLHMVLEHEKREGLGRWKSLGSKHS